MTEDDPEFDRSIALIDRIGAMLDSQSVTVQGTVLTGLVGRFITGFAETEADRSALLATYVQTVNIYLANLRDTPMTDYRYTPEQTLKSLWTRIASIAANEGVTIEELAKRPDRELMRLLNMGRLSMAALRERYPSPDGTDALARVNQLLAEQAAKPPAPKPRVIQIASDRVNLYLLRDDGTVWAAADNAEGWRKMRLPGEGGRDVNTDHAGAGGDPAGEEEGPRSRAGEAARGRQG